MPGILAEDRSKVPFRPSPAKISPETVVNLASRSRMRKRNTRVRSPRSMTRLRAC
jgi:hypothetical protein